MKHSHVLFALILILVLILSACAPAQTPAPTTVPAVPTIAPTAVPAKGVEFSKYQNGKPFHLIATNAAVPVVRIMAAGFLQACADYGLDCKIMSVPDNNIAGSVTLTEQAIALGSSCLVMAIYDKAWLAPASEAISKGIPVVNAHFPMKSDVVAGMSAWAAPDNVGYAVNSADAIADKIGCKGKVAVTQSSLNDGENAVAKSFKDEMAKKCPSVTVLDPQLETTDPIKAAATTGAILQANPDLTAAFGTTGGSIVAWTTSAKEAGKKPGDLVIIGMDFTAENIAQVDSGAAYALVAQPVWSEFYYSVVLLLNVKMGNQVPYENTLPSPLIYKGQTAPYLDILKKAEAVK